MSTPAIPVFDAARTADLLDFSDMVQEIKRACIELADGLIQASTCDDRSYIKRWAAAPGIWLLHAQH